MEHQTINHKKYRLKFLHFRMKKRFAVSEFACRGIAIESDESLHVGTYFFSLYRTFFFSIFLQSMSAERQNGEIKVSERGKPFMCRGQRFSRFELTERAPIKFRGIPKFSSPSTRMATAMCSVERVSFELKSIEAFPKTNDEDGTQYTRVQNFSLYLSGFLNLAIQVRVAIIFLPV